MLSCPLTLQRIATRAYGNEKEVDEGVRASGVPRSEIFITSKLWKRGIVNQTLANLGIDYLDCEVSCLIGDANAKLWVCEPNFPGYLIHWPIPWNPKGNHPVFPTLPNGKRDVDHAWDFWKQMEASACAFNSDDMLSLSGKVKSIEVSNFSEAKLEEILPTAEVIPAVNQLEIHVYNSQHKLISYLKSKGIAPQAYSPLGSTNSPLLTDEVITEVATKHSLQPADILLCYLLAKGIVVLPKSVTPARIARNFTGALAAAEKLDAADIDKLDGRAASGKQKRSVVPAFSVELGFEHWPPLPL
ncbi:NADP-dependent oxidoreductase domain-containing protein [Flammula alnicola]|nr:NADP-dependent oxidoreductase domain-containing protein [Flammula alnicola]